MTFPTVAVEGIQEVMIPEIAFIEDPFGEYEPPLLAPCQLKYNGQVHTITALLDTGASMSAEALIDITFARELSQQFGLPLKRLDQPLQPRGYYGRKGPLIEYSFFPRLQVFSYEQPSTLFFYTVLGQHKVLLGKKWMRRHGVVLDPHGNCVLFKGTCLHAGAPTTPQIHMLIEKCPPILQEELRKYDQSHEETPNLLPESADTRPTPTKIIKRKQVL
jgi:hypothetical protein